MDAAEQQIKAWQEKNAAFIEFLGLDRVNLCFTFSAGIDQKSIFQIYANQEAVPMFVMSDDAPLRDWTERINTFIQRREGTITMALLQGEMETSLKLLFKIASEPFKAPPSFSFQSPTPATRAPEPIPAWAQNPPAWSAASGSGDVDAGLDDSSIVPPTPTPAAVEPRTEESVRIDMEAWRDENEHAKLVITSVKRHEDGEHRVIALSMGEPAISFDLNCNADWTLAAVSSDHATLGALVEQFSEYISSTKPSLEVFFDDFSKLLEEFKDAWASGSIDEISDALKEIVANERGDEIDWKRVIPTHDNFEHEILPALHNFMSNDGLEIWQIDEWLRRARIEFDKSSGERNDAMQFINHNIFHGAFPPRSIRKFFPKPLPLHRRVTMNDNWKYPATATEAAKENLRQQMTEMDALQAEDHGFVAAPIRNNLFHWEIKLHGFEPETQIGQELISYTVNVSEEAVPKDANGKVKPLQIIMELKLPPNYPHGSPAFRIIRPRIFNDLERTFEDALNEDGFDTENERISLDDSSEKLKPEDGQHPLSFSMALERRKWNSCPKIIDLVRQIRGTLSRATNLHIDLNSSKKGIPTEGNFWNEYVCMAASSITNSYTDGDLGGKILLPAAALNELMGRSLYGSGGFNYGYGLSESGAFQNDSPMLFEIATTSGRRSFVGVMEFRAPEGHVGLPHWMMTSLGVSAGEMIQVRKVKLPKGLFFQLQPHSADFQRVSNVKAMMEWVLRRFVAVSEGDKLQVEHDGKKYRFNVLKCTPERAIAITDADVSVDFAAPLEGVVPEEDINTLTRSQEIKKHEDEMEKKKKDNVTLGSMFPQGKEGVDFKTCPNCFQPIPIANSLHELSCARRNWYCPDCKVVVLKTEKDAHMKEAHEKAACEWCNNTFEKRLIFAHKKSDCPGRSVMCQFCEMKLLAKQLYEHERTCGSVTEVCEKCRGRYARRELPYHESACTGTKAPPPARNNAGPNRGRPNEDFMACEKCSRAFTQFDELQVHILTEHSDEYDKFALFGGPGFKKEAVTHPASPSPAPAPAVAATPTSAPVPSSAPAAAGAAPSATAAPVPEEKPQQ